MYVKDAMIIISMRQHITISNHTVNVHRFEQRQKQRNDKNP